MRIIFLALLFLPNCLFAQESKVFDSLSFESKILNKQKTYAIYLPPGYETSGRKYPVLYLLHGGGGNQRNWIVEGNVRQTADKAIHDGEAVAMIIVMPDAENTFYMNNASGKYQFEDFFMKELIPYIEKTYRCLAEKKYRAIAGLSRGGFGALLYAIHYPQIFSSCAALSAGVRTDAEINAMPLKDFNDRYRMVFGDLKDGDKRITDFYNQNSILYLVERMPEAQKKEVRFYLDCGDDDFLYKGNSLLHIAMRDLNIPHQFRVRDGEHNWAYWRTGLPAVLQFVSESFK